MPTRTGLSAVFNRLDLAGCKPPKDMAARLSDVADVWISVLYDVSDADLAVAVTTYLREPAGAQWWPAPGALLALTPQGQRLAALSATAEEQFGMAVYVATHRHCRDNPPRDVDDPAWNDTRATYKGARTMMPWRWSEDAAICRALDAGVLACGGWRGFCNLDPEDHGTSRAAFRNAFRASLSRGPKSAVLARLEAGRGSPVRMIGQEKP